MISRLSSVFLMILVPMFVNGDECAKDIAALKWLESANPKEDAESVLKLNNTKIIGVYGFIVFYPGIDCTEGCEVKNSYIIEGTSDDLCNEEHDRLNSMAWSYAETFNKIITGNKNGL